MLPGVAAAVGAAVLFALGTVALRGPLGLPPLAATARQVGLPDDGGHRPALGRTRPRRARCRRVGGQAYMTAVPMGTWALKKSYRSANRVKQFTTAKLGIY